MSLSLGSAGESAVPDRRGHGHTQDQGSWCLQENNLKLVRIHRPQHRIIREMRENTRLRKIQDFRFWKDFPKITFQGDHSKFEFLECCLKDADIPRAAPPAWDLAYSRNWEVRISSDRLGKSFFRLFGNQFKTRYVQIFIFSAIIEIKKIQLAALALSPYAAERRLTCRIKGKPQSVLFVLDSSANRNHWNFHFIRQVPFYTSLQTTGQKAGPHKTTNSWLDRVWLPCRSKAELVDSRGGREAIIGEDAKILGDSLRECSLRILLGVVGEGTSTWGPAFCPLAWNRV